MDDPLLIAGAILVPLAFGLIPAFLPRAMPLFARWSLWFAVACAAAVYVAALSSAPPPFQTIALASAALAGLLSLIVLLTETQRERRPSAGIKPR